MRSLYLLALSASALTVSKPILSKKYKTNNKVGKRMKKKFYFIWMSMVLGILVVGAYKVQQARQTQSQIAENVIRFHVRADSNETKDQEIKIKVRNEVISKTKKYFQNCSSKKEAEQIILEHEEEMYKIAKKVVEREGETAAVNISYQKERFPLRTYGEYAFPPGIYDTLRIDIGKAEGRNWWCVMYPSLCYFDETEDIFDSRARKPLEKVVGEKAYYQLKMKDEKGKIKIKWKIYEIIKDKVLKTKEQ